MVYKHGTKVRVGEPLIGATTLQYAVFPMEEGAAEVGEPNSSLAIVTDRLNRQAFRALQHLKVPPPDPIQAATIRAHPEIAFAVHAQRQSSVMRQALGTGNLGGFTVGVVPK